FALNVDPDLGYFDNIVPCGIAEPHLGVTSLAGEGVAIAMREVVEMVAALAIDRWGKPGTSERADVVWRHIPEDLAPFSRGEGPGAIVGSAQSPNVSATSSPRTHTDGTSVRLRSRLAQAGVTEGLQISGRKPQWMRVKAEMGEGYRQLKTVMRALDLVTVCEEAGCPNIFDCWADGTATFMINGERCTRACGFCLVDTTKPLPPDLDEPRRIAEAIDRMDLEFAVLTTVARDDLTDGGASGFANSIAAIRRRTPRVGVEVLISDCKGEAESLDKIFDARPDVLNHNIETVARLQRMARPSASYARSLAVLARAKAAGLTTKSSIIVGMGETLDEVVQTLADLRGVGVDIVTIGQYLRPTSHHLPVARWVTPVEFEELKRIGEEELGIGHVESSPLTRSSYHAKQAAQFVFSPAPQR
ncbi:MAG: lipoyl synthase, partial [Acidimicrobiales bacterium]